RVHRPQLAGGDSLLERALDEARELPAVPEPLALGVALVLALVDQGKEEAPVPEVGQGVAHDALDSPRRRVIDLELRLELGPQPRNALEHDGQEEGALAREVPVQGAL